jgi:hypothetical protein
VDALSVLARGGGDASTRFACLQTWVDSDLPLGGLARDDREEFLAQVILRLDRFDPGDVRGQLQVVDRFAGWLVASRAVEDVAVVRDWARHLPVHPTDEVARSRRDLVQALLDAIGDRGIA